MRTPEGYIVGRPVQSLTEPAKPRTVKLRIAVCVGPDGGWAAWGGTGYTDADSMSCAVDDVGADAARHWVEAELPIPESLTVQGVVTQAVRCD